MARIFPFLLAFIAIFASAEAGASDYPNKTVTIVVPYGAGGSVTDIVARLVAEPMKKLLGRPVIVENKPGAGGAIGSIAIRNEKPDGYRILLGTSGTMIQRPLLYKEPQYGASEFTPIARVAYIAPFALIGPNSLQASTFEELVRYIRTNDTSFGTGNDPSMLAAAELLNWRGLTAVRVAYTNEGKALQEGILAGQLSWMFLSIPIAKEHITAKRVKAFATLGAARYPGLPDVPTIGELGAPELAQRLSWLGFFGPKGLPEPIVEKISNALRRALEDPEIQKRIAAMNLTVDYAGPQDFADTVAKDDKYFTDRIGVLRNKKLIAANQ